MKTRANRDINYRYIIVGKKIIAVSSFAKKPVRGVAVCSDSDHFNEANGKMLAALRCDEKVAKKRLNKATSDYYEVLEKLNNCNEEFRRVCNYLTDASRKYDEAKRATKKFSESL